MQIVEAILHKIVKQRDSNSASLEPRNEKLPEDKALHLLTSGVQKRYTNNYNQHGSFGKDPDLHRFPVLLNKYLLEEKEFVEFSETSARLVQLEMAKQPLATGGFIIFLRYTNQNIDYLLILMLKTKAQAGIKEATLDLEENYVFDIEHLHEAARIDVKKFMANESPYLTFVKPRSGKEDPSKFFRDALSCTDYIDSRHNTKQLIEALSDYGKAKDWDAERTQRGRKDLHEYCKEKSNLGEPINLSGLSARINDQDPDDFRTHIRSSKFSVSDTFSPHPETYNRLRRIAKKFGNINVAFDVDDLLSNNVKLVKDSNGTHHIEVYNLPSALIDEINKAKGL